MSLLPPTILNTDTACELLRKATGKQYTRRHVQRLCEAGLLRAERLGREWMIEKESVLTFKPERPGVKPKRASKKQFERV